MIEPEEKKMGKIQVALVLFNKKSASFFKKMTNYMFGGLVLKNEVIFSDRLITLGD